MALQASSAPATSTAPCTGNDSSDFVTDCALSICKALNDSALPKALKRKASDFAEERNPKRGKPECPKVDLKNFPRVLGYQQVPRDEDGYIVDDDDWPIDFGHCKRAGGDTNTPWPIRKFREATKAIKDEERLDYIRACPTNKYPTNSLQQAIKDWDHQEATNGGTHILEISYGFDGDHYYGAIDCPYPGNIAIPNWANGKGFHDLHDPYNHLDDIRRLCKEADEQAGEFVYLTLSDLKHQSDGLPCSDAMATKLEFATELYELLNRMCEDCLDHLLYDLDDDALAFFCSALSRIPTRPDKGCLAYSFKLY